MIRNSSALSDLTAGAVLTLALAASITGLYFGLAAWVIAALKGWPRPDLIGWGAGVSSALIAWLFLLRLWLRLLAASAGVDLSPLPPAEPKSAMVRVELASNQGRNLSYADLPVSLDQLKAWAHGVLESGSLAESNWVGGGNLFSKPEYSKLRDALVKRGLLIWNSPRDRARGVSLTRVGRAAFEFLSQEPPTLKPANRN